MVQLEVPDEFRYLNSEQSKIVLKIWGNPNSGSYGMLFPKDMQPFTTKGHWAFIINNYQPQGHIADSDAEKIENNDLLDRLKASSKRWCDLRKASGFRGCELVGWALPPKYDLDAHKFYWAKELKFEGQSENSLNYDIRILGRAGALEITAVSRMEKLSVISDSLPKVLPHINFVAGNQYSDFKPGIDRTAPIGLRELILKATPQTPSFLTRSRK